MSVLLLVLLGHVVLAIALLRVWDQLSRRAKILLAISYGIGAVTCAWVYCIYRDTRILAALSQYTLGIVLLIQHLYMRIEDDT